MTQGIAESQRTLLGYRCPWCGGRAMSFGEKLDLFAFRRGRWPGPGSSSDCAACNRPVAARRGTLVGFVSFMLAVVAGEGVRQLVESRHVQVNGELAWFATWSVVMLLLIAASVPLIPLEKRA